MAPKNKSIKEHSQEFLERKELIELQAKMDIEKHKRSMEELEFRRKTDQLHHDQEMERQRIKTAEIKKMQQRKENHQFMRDYGKK